MPKVSIVTPAYNAAPFVRQCLESVLAQSFGDWELVLVDDGSTDDTASVAASVTDPRIRVVRQENKGIRRLAETYNTALEQTSGEFVAILEADDYWPPDKLERQTAEFDGDTVLVSGPTQMVEEDGTAVTVVPEILPSEAARNNQPLGEGTLALLDVRHLTFTFSVSTVVRRSALEAVGGFRQPPYLPVVDLPTFVAVSALGPFRWCEGLCGYWRRHPSSSTVASLPEIL